MSKTTNDPSPELLELMAKDGMKKPHIDAIELLDLLTDLSEIDLPLALLERVQAAKAALMGQSRGGKKGGTTRAAQLRQDPRLWKNKILAAAAAYNEEPRKRASTIAKQLRISGDNAASYVRKVLREAGL